MNERSDGRCLPRRVDRSLAAALCPAVHEQHFRRCFSSFPLLAVRVHRPPPQPRPSTALPCSHLCASHANGPLTRPRACASAWMAPSVAPPEPMRLPWASGTASTSVSEAMWPKCLAAASWL